MTESILVTGATGTVGQHVVAALSDRDVDIETGVRDPETASEELADAGEAIEVGFTEPETRGRALAALDGLFLVLPPAVDRSEICSFVETADRVGVARVAYLSTLGAERNVFVPHHWIERRIVATDMEYTLLRASYIVQNLLEIYRRDVVERDEMFVPAGGGKTSFVDARHIGDAAAVVLTESGHADRASDLTGPEALGPRGGRNHLQRRLGSAHQLPESLPGSVRTGDACT